MHSINITEIIKSCSYVEYYYALVNWQLLKKCVRMGVPGWDIESSADLGLLVHIIHLGGRAGGSE